MKSFLCVIHIEALMFESILTWRRFIVDHAERLPRVRPLHCTSLGLTSANSPRGNLGRTISSCGDCVRALPDINVNASHFLSKDRPSYNPDSRTHSAVHYIWALQSHTFFTRSSVTTECCKKNAILLHIWNLQSISHHVVKVSAF